jgi:hypothetical protein
MPVVEAEPASLVARALEAQRRRTARCWRRSASRRRGGARARPFPHLRRRRAGLARAAADPGRLRVRRARAVRRWCAPRRARRAGPAWASRSSTCRWCSWRSGCPCPSRRRRAASPASPSASSCCWSCWAGCLLTRARCAGRAHRGGVRGAACSARPGIRGRLGRRRSSSSAARRRRPPT